MNKENDFKMAQLLDGLTDKTICVYYGKIPEECNVRSAVQLKREGRYEESLTIYLDIILNKGYMLTELGRAMSKTLCAMNEYSCAFLILFSCATVKWADKIGFNPLFATMGMTKDSMPTIPTPCAEDLFDLTDCLKSVLKGDFAPLRKRTIEWSGNQNYTPIQPIEHVFQQAQNLNNANILRLGER